MKVASTRERLVLRDMGAEYRCVKGREPGDASGTPTH